MGALKLSDLYNIKDVFYPSIFYPGDTPITIGSMSQKDYYNLNDKNELYRNFLIENYYNPLISILKDDSMAVSFDPQIITTDAYDSPGRGVHFSYAYFLRRALGNHNEEILSKMRQTSSLTEILKLEPEIKEALRNERKIVNEVLKEGKSHPQYEAILSDYNLFVEKIVDIPFNAFLENRMAALTQLIFGFRYYASLFSKPINIDELMDCFEYDQFCLCTMYNLLEVNQLNLKLANYPDTTIIHLEEFVSAVNKLREINPTYDCSIVDVDEKGKKRIRTLDQLIAEVNLLKQSQADTFTAPYNQILSVAKTLTKNNEIDISLKENYPVVVEAMNFIENIAADVRVNWEMLPKGERKVYDKPAEAKTPKIENPELAILNDERRKERFDRMMYCYDFLENDEEINKNKIMTLKGVNEFAGYIAYFFSNGRVLLEKYYEDNMQRTVAKERATYIMSLFEFVEFSKKKKLELIEIRKELKAQGITDVTLQRIPHYTDLERWKSFVKRNILTKGYSEQEVIPYIELLINQGTLISKADLTR